jgi:membrane protease YdiL (CAAX protease family)
LVEKQKDKRWALTTAWKYWLIIWAGMAAAVVAGGVLFFAIFPQYFDPNMTAVDQQLQQLAEQAGEPLPFSTPMLMAIQFLAALTFAIPINVPFMLGEEFGWRAYLQPKLMPLGPKTATVLVGVLWGVWHAPILAMGHNYGLDYPGYPITGILAMCWMCILLSIIWGWACVRAGSVWPAVIGHAVVNGSAGIVLIFVQGEPSTLLGPAIAGVVASLPMVPFALWLWLSPAAWQPPLPAAVDEITFSTEADKEKDAVAPDITFSSD